MHLDRTITDADNDRAARISQARPGLAVTVFFGWNTPDGMRLAPGRSSRDYKSEAGADKAARAWVSA